jgi:hypothetical protein
MMCSGFFRVPVAVAAFCPLPVFGAREQTAPAAADWLSSTPGDPPSPVRRADAATVAHGAYLARVGNCTASHTARGGQAHAGGRGLPMPFGAAYAGNLRPDEDTDLGRWSADDFWRALHRGRSRDGRLVTPALPYTAFTRISRDGSNALCADPRRVGSQLSGGETARPTGASRPSAVTEPSGWIVSHAAVAVAMNGHGLMSDQCWGQPAFEVCRTNSDSQSDMTQAGLADPVHIAQTW